MDRRAPALAWIVLACGLAARAEDKPAKPPQSLHYDVVVTATRLDTPAREVACSVAVITEQDLIRTRRTTVLEALREIIGLSVSQNGGQGATASISIRGANSEHTLVLIDGVETNDPITPSRSYDLAHLTLNQVERIEILRGPQSPLYGSDAMGGVINIITRKGRGRPALSLSGSGGNYGTAAADFGLSGSTGRADYSVGLAGLRTSGVSAASRLYPGNSEKDGYRNLSVSGKFGYAFGKNTDLEFMVRSVFARSGIDGFGGPYGDDPNSVQDYRSTLTRARLHGLSRGGRWEQALSFSWIGSSRGLQNPPDASHPVASETGTYGSGFLKLDWQNNIFLSPSQTLTAGLDLGSESGRSDYVYQDAGGTSESSFPSETARAAGLYIQDTWKLRRTLFLSAGARLDVHSRSGAALTFRIAPAFVVERTATKFKATLGTGFKSPSLYQLFAPPTAWGPIGNLNLRPERVTGWDLGVEQDILRTRLLVGLTYFGNSFRDLIDFDFLAGYINIGRARTSGLEMSLEARPAGPDGALNFRAAYTRLSARDEDSGEALLRRPRDKFSAEVWSRLFRRLDLTASLLFVGKRADRDFSAFPYETIALPGYVLLNAVVSTAVSPALDLFVRFDNLLGVRYELVWGYGTPGFSFNAGFRLTR
jgi:vitamin B12 transporter